MMANRFVLSGATLYQRMTLRHLADVGLFPPYILDFLDAQKGWVSALRDGYMVGLARDEFHERTASKDIQLIMPRNLSRENMKVVTHFFSFSAMLRKTLLQEIIGKKAKVVAIKKGCAKNFINIQESYISKFKTKLEECSPFAFEKRKLTQPFTTKEANSKVVDELLDSETLGKRILVSYVEPRYLNHGISSIPPMRRRMIANFRPERKPSKKVKHLSQQKKVLEVLAAAAIKGTKDNKLVGAQLNRLPLLFCQDDGAPFSRPKTGAREWLETRYPNAFPNHVTLNISNSIILRDGMQDIMTAPKSTFKTFEDYCHFFWNVKIAPSFRLSNCVGIIFDSQSRSVGPKDVTRAQRDATAKNECPVIKMGDETENEIDHNYTWIDFLKNRQNKKNLVNYICQKLRDASASDKLQAEQKLLVSHEDDVWVVTRDDECTICEECTNNHEEADTRIFFLAHYLGYR